MTRFVQITDTHFVPTGETLYGLDPQARLSGLLDLAARDHGDAGFILITGDLAHHGESIVEYLQTIKTPDNPFQAKPLKSVAAAKRKPAKKKAPVKKKSVTRGKKK